LASIGSHSGSPSSARQLDRVFDARAGAGHGLDILRVLLGREHLLEQAGELHLAVHAARLHVGQHAVQRADVARQIAHVAQPLVHLLQALGDLLEARGQACLERRL
jgi:hypothetical protein